MFGLKINLIQDEAGRQCLPADVALLLTELHEHIKVCDQCRDSEEDGQPCATGRELVDTILEMPGVSLVPMIRPPPNPSLN